MDELKIVASASYVPPTVITNDQLAQIMDTSDEWIKTRTGIRERRVSLKANTSGLCVQVAKELLKKSKIKAEEVDLIIVATMSPDSNTPATAAIVQGEIEAENAFAFDISAACSGFVYGLKVAANFLKDKQIKNVLLIGGEVLSKLVDWTDRKTAVLFGDGAAGVLLTRDDTQQSYLLSSDIKTFGASHAKLTAGCDQVSPSFPPTGARRPTAFGMDGREVYNFATRQVPKSLVRACEQVGLTPDQVDLFLLHQANARIIQSVAKKMKLPLEKFPTNIAKYGNTSAASIPLLLAELSERGMLERGQIIAFSGFGGGLTLGTVIIKY